MSSNVEKKNSSNVLKEEEEGLEGNLGSPEEEGLKKNIGSPEEEGSEGNLGSPGIELRLGDVILIQDATNDVLNQQMFLIDYIDDRKIKLVNAETLKSVILFITNGVIGDGNISEIVILSRNNERGYARQNGLLPNVWVNIYIGGDIPTIITGKITDLEEDMIEVRTTDNDTIYINFGYRGLPENIPIETFEIRSKPESVQKVDEEEIIQEIDGSNINELNENGFEGIDIGEQDIDIDIDNDILEEEENQIPTKAVRERIKNMIIAVDDLDFGEYIKVEEYVNVDKSQQRYNLETQTNDLLEELLSQIPNTKRTSSALNSIHIMINRFVQLRNISSTFDGYKNISGVIKKSAEDRPLAEYLSQFKNSLYWVLLVASNVKKIHQTINTEGDGEEVDREDRRKEYREDGINGDIMKVDENEELSAIQGEFTRFRSNGAIEGIPFGKYVALYNGIKPYMTPFYSQNMGTNDDGPFVKNNIIIESQVETDMNVIIDNLEDLYSSVISRGEIVRRKYVIQRYNLGLDRLQADNLKGSRMMAHRVKLTPNDVLSVNSIVTLPEPTLRFSQVNLPGTDMLIRANLNRHFLNYWELLKQKTAETNVIVDGLNNELEYTDDNFVDNIKKYMLDLSDYDRPAGLTNLDIYRTFLRTIVPKIKILFSMIKKYIKGKLSLVDVVRFLEPCMIYPEDLTFTQYNEINSFIREKIKAYNIRYKECGSAFSDLKNMKRNGYGKTDGKYTYTNSLFNIFDGNLSVNKNVFETYNVNFEDGISGSEFLKHILTSDYGNIYNTAVAYSNISLMYPKELNAVFELDKEKMKQVLNKQKNQNKNGKNKDEQEGCLSYVIAKKYYDLGELTEDNGKEIFFDKEYDKTNYDIIQEKYKKEKDTLGSEEFIVFLTQEFKKKNGLTEEIAKQNAESLVNQAKNVRTGHYAILINTLETDINKVEGVPEEMVYYVRTDNRWEIAAEVDPNWFIKEDDVLCNINYNCMYDTVEKSDEKCVPSSNMKTTIVAKALKDIMDQFDKRYDISKEELNEKLTKSLKGFELTYLKKVELNRRKINKYNDEKYELGLTIDSDANVNSSVKSPYTKLRDLIVGQDDFVKKQGDIIRFAALYCRVGDPALPNVYDGDMENEWWLYCLQTGTKLMPAFRLQLASAFIRSYSEYDRVLNDLIKRIGKQSDDGDAWVDENSGEVLCYIDFDIAEGYKDGFVDKSRAVMEQDESNQTQTQTQIGQTQDKNGKELENGKKMLTLEGQLVSNMVSALSSNMGIEAENVREFVVKVVTELLSNTKVIEKEQMYKEREKEMAKKGKKLPEYVKVFSQTMLYLTLGTFLIAIQTSIPSIRTRKTFPGCVRSFIGFPIDGEGDDSALKYLSCVALKQRDGSTVPWSQLPKDVSKIEIAIKTFIVKFLLPYFEVEERMRKKVEYLLLEPELIIPMEHSLQKWTTFLPPLCRFHIKKKIENISAGFMDMLKQDIISGHPKQHEKLLVLRSKIYAFSLGIQESIQNIIDKKDMLMKGGGQPFMDNACCNDRTDIKSALEYFIEEDVSISQMNLIVRDLSVLIKDIDIITKASIFLPETNTKRVFPIINGINDISEETIYLAFIRLCGFQTLVSLPEDLKAICIDKPDYLNATDTIAEKIEKLKRDGRNYTAPQFLRLFQIICQKNIVYNSSNSSYSINKKDDYIVHKDYNFPQIRKVVEEIMSLREINLQEKEVPEVRKYKNWLDIKNEEMRSALTDFIRTKGRLTGNDNRKILAFINTDLMNWKYNNIEKGLKETDGFVNHVAFLKNSINAVGRIFPTMLFNESKQSIEPHKYWSLSRVHIGDIKKMIETYYRPLDRFYGNEQIKNMSTEIVSRVDELIELSSKLPNLTLNSVVDSRLTLLLFEHILLLIITEYIRVTQDPDTAQKLIYYKSSSEKADMTDLFAMEMMLSSGQRDIESTELNDNEVEYIEGDLNKLREETAQLLVAFLTIMMRSKKTIDVTFADVEDQVFKQKEAEKYSFTDRLKDMKEEERQVDTLLKHYKLGPLYSIGLSKGLREYDADNFERDKQVAEKVYEIQKKLKRKYGQNTNATDMDLEVEGAMEEINLEDEIERDNMNNLNEDNFEDGDPWGDEREYDDYGEYN